MPQDRTIGARSQGGYRLAEAAYAGGASSLGSYHVDLVASVLGIALQSGVSQVEVETWLGPQVAMLGLPGARLADDVPHLALLRLADAIPSPAPLHLAIALPNTALGGLVHGMQFAPDLGAALDFLARNAAILGDRLSITRSETGTAAKLAIAHPNDALDAGRLSSTLLLLVARALKPLLGDAHVLAGVTLRDEVGDRKTAYGAALGCAISFGAPVSMLVFRSGAMQAPILSAQPAFFASATAHATRMLEGLGLAAPGDGGLGLLRRAIATGAATGDFGVAGILHRSRLSRRTAQRLTARHGTTLGALIEEARLARAKLLLSDRGMSIERAAQFLGYSDDRAFRRAFKRWTGQSPAGFRRGLKARGRQTGPG
ncbi:MAG: helix-turn-helix domain-containing protein [Pseudomonadota bacterium]